MSRRWEMCVSLIKSGCALLGIVMLVSVPINIAGQELVTSRTDGHTPSALTAGAPVGSYPLSGFESVNPYNGALNFQFPLLRIGGRGSAGYTMMLPIETKWNVERHVWPPPNPTCSTGLCPWQNEQTNPVDFHMPGLVQSAERYKPGKLETRSSGEGYTDCAPNDTTVYYVTTLTRFTFTLADGTQIEFRDAATGGQPRPNPMGSQCQSGMGFNRGKVFFAGDGSAATFISDTDVQDFTRAEDGPGSPTGHVRFADGTTYRVEDGQIIWIRDRNGNKVTPTTDALGRQVTVALTDYQTTLFDQISYKGFGGATRNIKVWYGPLSEILRVTQPGDSATIKTYNQLFPGLNLPPLSNPDFNPFLVRRLELPDGRNYRFFYNVYAELTRIELPTGGAIEYDHDGGLNAGTSGLVNGANPGIYRRAIERRIYSDATNLNSLESKTTFSRPQMRSVTDYDEFVDVTEFNAANIVLSRVRHFYHSNAGVSFFWPHFPNEYTDWREGKEYKTEFYDANNNLLKRVENLWEQTPATGAANNPHITRTTTTLTDITPNLVTKQEFTYDQYNNPIDQYEYDFGPGGPGPLKRRTHTDYVAASAYTDAVTGAHLRRLKAQVSVFDVNNIERSRSSFEYDNYTTTPPNHASLILRSNISGFDATFSTGYSSRGNVTAATSYLLTNGSITGSITAYNHYDIAGNVVKSLDPRGFVTDFEFFDHFGAPDGEARGHTQPAELGAASTYAFVTKVTNALGHQAYTQFDYYLGQPVDAEDANGMIVSAYFNDVLDRPTQLKRGVGTGVVNETTFAYDDGAARTITTTSDLDADRDLVSKTLYDGLGRTIETRTYEGGDNFIAVKQIPFTMQQDPDSGAWLRSTQSSNPYRLYLNEQPVWTTTFFDALGRVVKVRTPDNAIVRTSYSANTVTVKDQAGKTRKSVTDTLGRLIEIYEDPEVPGGPPELDHQTTYTYDVLDNLVKVTQGSQQRFFTYDSLKRLIRARNPEQGTLASLNLLDSLTGNSAWSTGYQYDANSNLMQKTDARGVVSTYAYDALNRNTTIDYSDTVSINPDVSRLYDGATKGKGRLWSSEAGGTEKTVVTSYDELGRPVVLQQSFKLPNNTWKLYETSRAYNLAGGVTSQFYPSNHSVTYNYDAAGRLGDKDALNPAFKGNLGDGVTRTYASGNTYTSWGSLFMEKFGTQTSLYHKLQYNIRGQLWDVRVSTGSDVNGSWNRGALQFFYEPTYTHGASGPTNNGNVLKSSHYVPDDQGGALAIPHQFYTYDSLNRLTSVAEYFISDSQPIATQTSLQTFSYDRWGNRTIDAAQTWGTGINNKQFTVDPNTNRLGVPSGQSGGMSYDTAGNLITDTYTGAGARTYDAENRMTQAWGGDNQWQYYTYNADGQRTRRKINNQETWLVYGFDGELLAEYPADGAVANPQKEYGYRNGQLLITAEPPRTNVALAANGATASASSQYSTNYPAYSTINGDRRGLNWNAGGGWNDATVNTHPDWLQIDFNGSKTIDEINVITLQDNPATPAEPTESMTFTLYGLTGYSVQYWNGSAWTTVTGGTVSGNNKVWKKFTFAAITTTKIRVLTSSSPDGYSRITEVEAWSNEAAPLRTNFALGGLTSASSQYSANYPAFSTINGDRRGLNWNNGGGWNDGTVNTHPDWLQIDFNGSKTIDEINVITLQDNPATPAEPTESMTFTLYGLTGYSVQYWNGSAWTTVSGGTVTGNNKVWRKFTFSPITTTKIRVLTSSSADAYSRLTEVEAWGPTDAGSSVSVKWLVPDHLGTPRIVVDQTGNLAGVRRHDYLPFGEELFADTGGRTGAMGYAGGDGVRQQFTAKERDIETGLDYFGTRFYSSSHGRFVSCDPNPNSSRHVVNPQRWNLYVYVLNNPLALYDPDGQTDQTQDKTKVIVDIFLFADPDLKGRDKMTTSQRRELDRIVGQGAKVGVQINVHEGPADATGLAALSALKNSNVVVFGPHAGVRPDGTMDAVPTADGTFVREGLQRAFEDKTRSVDVDASIVGVMGCDSALVRHVFQGADTFIGVSGGSDHVSTTYGLNGAIIATAKTIVDAKGDLGPNTIKAIANNAQTAIRSAYKAYDQDDTVRINPVVVPPPAKNTPYEEE